MENSNLNDKEHASLKHEKGTDAKARIYNLIIVDESGSMSGLEAATKSGVNEIIQTVRQAQETLGERQDHFLSLVTFDSSSHRDDVRTLLDAVPIAKVQDFGSYMPFGGTPLYDAIGCSLTRLHEHIQKDENATAVVTILTDGLENDSKQWTQETVRRLISDLKEEGWSFSYIGSCHDVLDVSIHLSIDHAMAFSHDETGVRNSWEREKSSRKAYFEKMSHDFDPTATLEKKKEMKRRNARGYYTCRVTPNHISKLSKDEVLVFGSNPQGQHLGGVAYQALRHFGARMGQGEGLQGSSYAIPTTDGMGHFRDAVDRFLKYADCHPEMRFYVTRIGCGHSGYTPMEVAPLFGKAIHMENVFLPEEFWQVLGLKLF